MAKETNPKNTQPSKPAKENKNYYQAIGRRKSATARVRLYPIAKSPLVIGSATLQPDDILVNNHKIEDYFVGLSNKKRYMEPFEITKTTNRFAATIKIEGSGTHGQLDAIVLGISRALLKIDRPKYHPLLKKALLLSRDPREKERRKAGLAGKARAGKQSPKR